MVLFYKPEDDRPYQTEDLAGRTEFVNAVADRTVSQADLEKLLERFGPDAHGRRDMLPF